MHTHIHTQVKLPLEVAVVQHTSENKNKSTAVHAHLVSDDVNIYTFPSMPRNMNASNAVSFCAHVHVF